MYTKKKFIIVYVRRKNARQNGLSRAFEERNNVFAQLAKTRHGANVASSGQREKSLSARFPAGVYSVEIEKVSVDFFVLVRFKILVLAVDFNHTFEQAAVFGEKPRCFNRA